MNNLFIGKGWTDGDNFFHLASRHLYTDRQKKVSAIYSCCTVCWHSFNLPFGIKNTDTFSLFKL